MRSLLRYSLVAAALGALVLLSIATLTRQIEQKAYAQAVGKTLVISSFRANGPGGTSDEFVEIFNTTNSPILASGVSLDPSAPSGPGFGIGVFANAGPTSASAKPSLVCQIPGTVTIPARGHYLCYGAAYSLTGLGANIGSGHPGDQLIGAGRAVVGNIPDDAGLLLAPFGSDIVVACTLGDPGCNSGFAVSGVAVWSPFDKVGFTPYGPGAPPPGRADPAANLSGNYCETNCLRPVGDGTTASGAFSDCAGNSTADFPTSTSALGRCYGMSGQYKIERRRTNFNATAGDISRDTDNNTDDLIFVAPSPGINTGTNVTGITGVSAVLGAAAPWGLCNPGVTGPACVPGTGPANAPRPIGKGVFSEDVFDSGGLGSDPLQPLLGTNNGPRNSERRYGQDPVIVPAANDPLGLFIYRRSFINNGSSTITGGVFRVDNLATLCGPQTGTNGIGSVTGTGESRNLSATPNCQGASSFTAVLKAVNGIAETVVDFGNSTRTVQGTVLEDVAGTPGLSPNGGGIDNTLGVNTSTAAASRGDGTRDGTGTYGSLTAPATGSASARTLRVGFWFGVVKSGRFIFLVQPELSGASPAP